MYRWLLAALAVSLLISCGNEEEQLKIKRDIANIQEQIYQVERTQAELRQQLKDRLDDVERQLDDRTEEADTSERLRNIQQDLSQYKALVLDLESRLADLKRASSEIALPTTKPADAVDGDPGDEQPSTPEMQTVSGDVVEQQFNQALLDFNRGKFEVAIVGFQDILDNFPNSPFTEPAHYYLGTSYFQKKDYQKAREHFSLITTRYSQGDYIKQAMYYEGRSYYELNQPSKAILTLRDLIDRYPGTQEAVLASQFLKRTGYER